MEKLEEIVLGRAIRSEGEARMLVEMVGERATAFHHGAARTLYRTIARLVQNGQEVSLPSVGETLSSSGQIADIGGGSELLRLMQQAEDEQPTEVLIHLLLQQEADAHSDIIYADDILSEVQRRLDGWREPTYSLGFEGGRTDQRIQLTEDGGLWILTGTPGSGKTAWLRCVLAQLMVSGRRVAMLSFEEMNKAKQIVRLVQLISGHSQTKGMPEEARNRILGMIDRQQVHLTTREHEATIEYILQLADRVYAEKKVDMLVIDPYLYVEEDNHSQSETQRIKNLLKALRNWAETRGVWVIVVAHPRMLHKDEKGEYETVDQYTISGSAHWANMADYVCVVKRSFIRKDPDKGSEVPSYTTVDVVKVRDQDVCKTGRLYYLRAPSGRYIEAEDEALCKEILGAAEQDPQEHGIKWNTESWVYSLC